MGRDVTLSLASKEAFQRCDSEADSPVDPLRSGSSVKRGFMPSVLEKVRDPGIGLAIWQRYTRLNLRVIATAMLAGPSLTLTVADEPDRASRRLCQALSLFHWPLFADMRRLARRFSLLTGSPIVRMRFEYVTDDSCRKFHVDAVGLRLLCTYAGAGTEWIVGDVIR